MLLVAFWLWWKLLYNISAKKITNNKYLTRFVDNRPFPRSLMPLFQSECCGDFVFLYVSFFLFRMLMYFVTFRMLFLLASYLHFVRYIFVIHSSSFSVSLSFMFCWFPQPDFKHLVSRLVYRQFVFSFSSFVLFS